MLGLNIRFSAPSFWMGGGLESRCVGRVCGAHTTYAAAHTNKCTYICYLINIKFTLKHLKRSYMFHSHDHPQGAYIVPC